MEFRAASALEQHRFQGRWAVALPGSIGLASLGLLAASQIEPLQTGAVLLGAAALVAALV